MKICLIHLKIRTSLADNIKAASREILKAAEEKPAFFALPEYFSVPGCMNNFISAEEICKKTYTTTIHFLAEISKKIQDAYLLGGTVVEEEDKKFYNTSTMWHNGLLIGKYKKVNPIAGELKAGIAKGTDAVVLDTNLCKVGLLICADMFDPFLVKRVASLGAEMVYLPVAAMGTHPTVNGHPLTEKVASENGMFVLKVGNVCSNTKGGRSAVIAPWGIIDEVSDSPRDTIIVADLDLEKLRAYRVKLSIV